MTENGQPINTRDEGLASGVPADEREQRWTEFHRGSARPIGGESHPGLGLHIAEALTEAMGDRVSHAAREPLDGARGRPRGSVFRIELPQGRAGIGRGVAAPSRTGISTYFMDFRSIEGGFAPMPKDGDPAETSIQ